MRRVGFMLIATALAASAAGAGVELARTPDGGVYPRAAVDERGVVHLIYFKGDPQAGNVFYVRSEQGGEFGKPIQVNSQDKSAMIIGTVRGPQLALGKGSRVHVAWMGSQAAMFYTRIDETGSKFEAQRNLIVNRPGLDGGGAIAADALGHVFVVWHAPARRDQKDEAGRRVWIVRSDDGGGTFSTETDGGCAPRGVCACCNLGAWARDGSLHVLYRCATEKVHRDMHLLSFNDQLRCTRDETMAQTRIGKCI